MLDFQRYQAEFSANIRAPKLHKKPAHVNAKRMAVYQKAVFNNTAESISVCFPVCQAVFGKRVWGRLLRKFLANYAAASPIFREIPAEFLQFLHAQKDLPAYFYQLAHYEWAELAVSSQINETLSSSQTVDLMNEKPILVPAHSLLKYDYPVHKISPGFKHNNGFKPSIVEQTYLLVFRNSVFDVKFIELNPVTYQLLSIIENNNMTGKQALLRLADDIKNLDATTILQFGGAILTDLADQEAIVGSINVN